MILLRALCALLVVFGLAGAAAAQTLKDVAGGRDHPLIKRYEGSVMLAIEEKAFDE